MKKFPPETTEREDIEDDETMQKVAHYGIAACALTLFVAVKKKKNIRYKKTDSKRVLAVCAQKDCPWRIYASINSSSPRVVVSLLTNARIAELYIEELRENPNISGMQLQNKLLRRNINVPWTICERIRCLQAFDREQEAQFGRLHDYVYEKMKELEEYDPVAHADLKINI
ncbi:unnamed protein product [Thlaspi arvense]|uniref:Transposase MuDR plant domain-containing protein n=1 Tax=Thlaspi arvense TaxID=13288 RepID=A0AAU9RQ83_THLAR|nr:unnamed protein product [Thlaspi arvense]